MGRTMPRTGGKKQNAVQARAEWVTGLRTPGWDRLWHHLLSEALRDAVPGPCAEQDARGDNITEQAPPYGVEKQNDR